MGNLTLNRLVLDNFKGCRHLDLLFAGKDATIYGDNAVGKTTIYDGLTWLLFGHDSHGQTTFEIKPLDSAGNVADHGAVTTVEGTFYNNGTRVCLRKNYYEKWGKRRGCEEAVFEGHTSEFFVDDVPMKKSAYGELVEELVPPERFMMLSITDYFCEKMPWRKRRETLFDLCQVADDDTILASMPDGNALAVAKGRLSMEDLKAKLQAQRKGLVGVQNTTPARMDECQKIITSISAMDFSALKQERLELDKALEIVQARRMQCQQGTLANNYRNTIGERENQLQALHNANESFKNTQRAKEKSDLSPVLECEEEACKGNLEACNRMYVNTGLYIGNVEADIKALRDKWMAANAMTFDHKYCPTCGQALPPAEQEEALAKFELRKRQELDTLVKESVGKKEALQEAYRQKERDLDAVETTRAEYAKAVEKRKAYVAPVALDVMDMPGFAEKAERITAELTDAKNGLAELEQKEHIHLSQLYQEEDQLHQQMDKVNKDLALESHKNLMQERLDQLRQEAKQAATVLADVDKVLYMIEEFTRYKVSFISEAINQKFKLCRFKLFKELVNGGLDECCDVTVGGVPYQSLNNGARINAGLDVIRTLSAHYGDRVPLFVDNAEAVTQLMDMDTQVIRLVVSAQDKNMRVEGTK